MKVKVKVKVKPRHLTRHLTHQQEVLAMARTSEQNAAYMREYRRRRAENEGRRLKGAHFACDRVIAERDARIAELERLVAVGEEENVLLLAAQSRMMARAEELEAEVERLALPF